MKNILILCVCFTFFIDVPVFSQRKKIENLPNFDKKTWNFGYYLGFNKNSFVVDYKKSVFSDASVKVEDKIGFIVGVMVERRLHKNLSLRFEPGLMSNVKTLTFNNPLLPTQEDKDRIREVPGTYLHMPILLKFSTNRLKNIKPYVVGGLTFDWNFSANQDNPDDNSAGEFRMKKMNNMYELGVGVDFYLPYFKFSPSIRGVFAMNTELIDDNSGSASPWTAPIDNFATRGIFLKFTFE